METSYITQEKKEENGLIQERKIPDSKQFLSFFTFISQNLVAYELSEFLKKQNPILMPYQESIVKFHCPIRNIFMKLRNEPNLFFKDLNPDTYLMSDFVISSEYKYFLTDLEERIRANLSIVESYNKKNYLINYEFLIFYSDDVSDYHLCLLAPLSSFTTFQFKYQEGNSPCLNPYELDCFLTQANSTLEDLFQKNIYNIQSKDLYEERFLPIAPSFSKKAIYYYNEQEYQFSLFFPYISDPQENLTYAGILTKNFTEYTENIENINDESFLGLLKKIPSLLKTQIKMIVVKTLIEREDLMPGNKKKVTEKKPENFKKALQEINSNSASFLKSDMDTLIQKLLVDTQNTIKEMPSKHELDAYFSYLMLSLTGKGEIISKLLDKFKNSEIAEGKTLEYVGVVEAIYSLLNENKSSIYKVSQFNQEKQHLFLKLNLLDGEKITPKNSQKKDEVHQISIELLPYWEKQFTNIKVVKSVPNHSDYANDLYYLLDIITQSFPVINAELDVSKFNAEEIQITLRSAIIFTNFEDFSGEIVYGLDCLLMIMIKIIRLLKEIVDDMNANNSYNEKIRYLSANAANIIDEIKTIKVQYNLKWNELSDKTKFRRVSRNYA